MSKKTEKKRSEHNRDAKSTEEQKKTERRTFLREAAAATAGAALLATAGGKVMAQECPKRDLTLDEMKAFARDLAVASDASETDLEKLDAKLAVVEQYLRPLVDEDGRIPDSWNFIFDTLLTGPQ